MFPTDRHAATAVPPSRGRERSGRPQPSRQEVGARDGLVYVAREQRDELRVEGLSREPAVSPLHAARDLALRRRGVDGMGDRRAVPRDLDPEAARSLDDHYGAPSGPARLHDVPQVAPLALECRDGLGLGAVELGVARTGEGHVQHACHDERRVAMAVLVEVLDVAGAYVGRLAHVPRPVGELVGVDAASRLVGDVRCD